MNNQKYILKNVKSENQAEFASLIGQVGLLKKYTGEYGSGFWFHDLIILPTGKIKKEKDLVIFKTKLGNTFTFREYPRRDR